MPVLLCARSACDGHGLLGEDGGRRSDERRQQKEKAAVGFVCQMIDEGTAQCLRDAVDVVRAIAGGAGSSFAFVLRDQKVLLLSDLAYVVGHSEPRAIPDGQRRAMRTRFADRVEEQCTESAADALVLELKRIGALDLCDETQVMNMNMFEPGVWRGGRSPVRLLPNFGPTAVAANLWAPEERAWQWYARTCRAMDPTDEGAVALLGAALGSYTLEASHVSIFGDNVDFFYGKRSRADARAAALVCSMPQSAWAHEALPSTLLSQCMERCFKETAAALLLRLPVDAADAAMARWGGVVPRHFNGRTEDGVPILNAVQETMRSNFASVRGILLRTPLPNVLVSITIEYVFSTSRQPRAPEVAVAPVGASISVLLSR